MTLGVAVLLLGSCATPHLHRHQAPAPETIDDLTLASPQRGAAPPPIALMSADGKELVLKSVKAQSIVAGPLAFTQLKLVFHNPEVRTIEGRFRIALPSGASVSRFAMKIGDAWQEGEMLEKAKARGIYEDFLHRRVDPALLEQGVGNAFTARVFPIFGRADKHLIISYSQPLDGPGDTLVPLEGLPRIEELDLEITKDGPQPKRAVMRKAGFKPEGDFVLDPELASSDGLRSGDLVVMRIAAMSERENHALKRTLFLVDTSASRALDLPRQLNMLRAITRRMGDERILVAAFDQSVELFFEGKAGSLGRRTTSAIQRRRAMGASDLRSALSWASRNAKKHGYERVVMLGDGVATAGAEGKRLVGAAKDLRLFGVERLDIVAFGGIRDEDGMRRLVTAGLPRDGVVLDSQRGAADVWRRLNLATKSGVEVEVEGASWWSPRKLDGVQPGDEVLVHAKLDHEARVQVRVDGEPLDGLRFVEAQRPLVERSWARAKIASLVDREKREGKSFRKEIVALSTRHRVMSPYTSLLVLETQADYERYKLDRASLADILEVRSGRLVVAQRKGPKKTAAAADPNLSLGQDPLSARGSLWGDEIGESFGAGGLGLSGVGEGGGGRSDAAEFGMIGLLNPGPTAKAAPPAAQQPGVRGFGSGHGRLGRAHRARPPRIRMGATTVSGRLPPEIIQRIVRANFGRFRACYQALLQQNPQEHGRLAVRFIIERDGTVKRATTTSSTFTSATFKRCVSRSFTTLKFPQPVGGRVTVIYPLVFQPNGSTAPAPQPLQPSLRRRPPPSAPGVPGVAEAGAPAVPNAHRGNFAKVMRLLKSDERRALAAARRWHAAEPGNVLALVALGESHEANRQPIRAARAYGSIIDLFPSRTDLRRYAGERLDRVDADIARRLAIDTYERAREQRPDHPTSHRLLGYALLRAGQHEQAFLAVADGLAACKGQHVRAAKVLRRDLGLIAAAWVAVEPDQRAVIDARLTALGATLATQPSTTMVLNWETDVNDVDLHVYDTAGDHAYYASQSLGHGGRLHGDITTGYGPELFTIEGKRRARGYKMQVHYYARGPMGYGMGKLHVIEHDGKGTLEMVSHPFVVMNDQAYVDVGTLGAWKSTEN